MDYHFQPKFQTKTEFTTITCYPEVLSDKRMTYSQRIIFSYLLEGFRGSQKDLAPLTGIHERTVGDQLTALADKGFIKIERKGLYNLYVVTHSDYIHLYNA